MSTPAPKHLPPNRPQARPESELKQAILAHRGDYISIAVFSFFINLSALAVPIYMLQVFDRVLSSRSEATLVMLTVVIGFLLFIFSLLESARGWLMVRLGEAFEKDLTQRTFSAVFRNSLMNSSGGHAQALRDLGTIRQFMSGPGLLAFLDAPWAPLFLLVIYLFQPVMGAIAIVGSLLLVVLAVANEFATKRATKTSTDEAIKTSNYAEASLRNGEAIHAMGMLDGILGRWGHKHDRALQMQRRAAESTTVIMAAAKLLRLSLQIVIMGTGAYFVIEQSITPGAMIAGAVLLGRALMPFEQAVAQWRQFSLARSAYERVNRLLEDTPEPSKGMVLSAPKGLLQVEQILVMAPGTQNILLKNIAFNLNPGASLGIVGPSGAGKSTLARVMLGIWPAKTGAVRLDGADVANWNSTELGPYIGYLPQDVELLDGTVAENIARFAEVDSAEVERAAKRVGVHNTILRLPKGYDTPVGESGGLLSGGQRQRIGLARAIYGNPVLVVLDEPNASLDGEGELALSSLFQELKRQGTTLVVIAHRPSILAGLDGLLVLKEGAQQMIGPAQQVLQSLQGQNNVVPLPAARAQLAQS